MTKLPLKEMTDLASKHIFATCTVGESSSSTTDSKFVSVDMYCSTCLKEKTFSGEGYTCEGLIFNALHESAQRVSSLERVHIELKDESAIRNLVAEKGSNLIVPLECKTCGTQIFICYHAVKEFNLSLGFSEYTKLTKIGEYPNQNEGRLMAMRKYTEYFPEIYPYLVQAESSFHTQLGVGAIIYLRKAYETLLVKVLGEAGLEYVQNNFRASLERADNTLKIVPHTLKDRAYGLFGEMSSAVHVGGALGSSDVDEDYGLTNYTVFRDLLLSILDNILQNRSYAELALRIPTDAEVSRRGRNR